MAEPLTYDEIREACYQRCEGDDGDERFDAWVERSRREAIDAHLAAMDWGWVALMMTIAFEHRPPAPNVATAPTGDPCRRCFGVAWPCDARVAAESFLGSHGLLLPEVPRG